MALSTTIAIEWLQGGRGWRGSEGSARVAVLGEVCQIIGGGALWKCAKSSVGVRCGSVPNHGWGCVVEVCNVVCLCTYVGIIRMRACTVMYWHRGNWDPGISDLYAFQRRRRLFVSLAVFTRMQRFQISY